MTANGVEARGRTATTAHSNKNPCSYGCFFRGTDNVNIDKELKKQAGKTVKVGPKKIIKLVFISDALKVLTMTRQHICLVRRSEGPMWLNLMV